MHTHADSVTDDRVWSLTFWPSGQCFRATPAFHDIAPTYSRRSSRGCRCRCRGMRPYVYQVRCCHAVFISQRRHIHTHTYAESQTQVITTLPTHQLEDE